MLADVHDFAARLRFGLREVSHGGKLDVKVLEREVLT